MFPYIHIHMFYACVYIYYETEVSQNNTYPYLLQSYLFPVMLVSHLTNFTLMNCTYHLKKCCCRVYNIYHTD